MKNQTAPKVDDRVYRKLVESPLYQTYRKAFTSATGLSLTLLPIDADTIQVEQPDRFQNPFCKQLNENNQKGCKDCELATQCLRGLANESAETITCFANLRETAIPIRAADKTVAILSTGQVFTELPDESQFDAVAKHLTDGGISQSEIDRLHESWLNSRVIPREQYAGTITILAAFALQLSELLNRLLIEDAHSEPEVVTQARRFVNANLEDKICLEAVSKRVGVSSFYFCKIFKQTTGMTLTEYVNRRRVEWAKRKLLNPQARVTEVAFDVGYQSLSQFNRSFLKYVGVSPTRYREQQEPTASAITKIAA